MKRFGGYSSLSTHHIVYISEQAGRQTSPTGKQDDNYRARYYHPRLQRFISEDPIGLLSGSFNFYAYVINVSFRDPIGLFRMSGLDQRRFPKTADYLKNRVKVVAKDQKILDALRQFGQLSKSKVHRQVQFGRGPCVLIQALEGGALGRFDGTNLIIDSSVAAALEGCSNPADCAVAELFLEGTLLHEFTHYGDT